MCTQQRVCATVVLRVKGKRVEAACSCVQAFRCGTGVRCSAEYSRASTAISLSVSQCLRLSEKESPFHRPKVCQNCQVCVCTCALGWALHVREWRTMSLYGYQSGLMRVCDDGFPAKGSGVPNTLRPSLEWRWLLSGCLPLE